MTYNLLYIDDDPRAEAIADGFNTTGLIAVKIERPTSFEKELHELAEKQNQFQGLILDLRLDENQSGERKASYTATSLAEQIRSSVLDGVWKKEFPLILFTTQQNFERLHSSNAVSQRLFDIVFLKERISDTSIQNKIHAIVKAYLTIASVKPNISKILGIARFDFLDKRIFNGKLLTGENATVYDYASFILKELILTPGPLIDEEYLAARLGIDKEKSKDWEQLKQKLTAIKYVGIFSDAWHRWWMHFLNEWWENEVCKEPMATLDARERVTFLKDKLGLTNLEWAEPLPKNASYRYWTICQGYRKPLDPREGLRIDCKDPLPWQETLYMSIEAALERVDREKGLKVHPLERERLNQIKKTFSS